MIEALEQVAFAATDMTFANLVPMGRDEKPDEIAALICSSLSHAASFSTRTADSVDGAFTTG